MLVSEHSVYVQNDPNAVPSRITATRASNGADDPDHYDIEIALAVCRSADGEQCHHRAVVRQDVKRPRTDHGNAVHQRGMMPVCDAIAI